MSVRAVERTFEILEAVAHDPSGLGVRELAREVSLPKSTVSRLLLTLESLGVVERVVDNGRYVLGQRIQALTTPLLFPASLIATARPHMLRLNADIGEDVALAIPEGDSVHYIEQIVSEQQAVRVKEWVGSRFPLHATSSGKLFLALMPEQQVARYLSKPLIKYSEKTISSPERLRKNLADIRRQGVDWSVDEFAEGFVGVSAPIFGKEEKVVAALNIFAPSYRFPKDKKAEMNERLVKTAVQISEKIQ